MLEYVMNVTGGKLYVGIYLPPVYGKEAMERVDSLQREQLEAGMVARGKVAARLLEKDDCTQVPSMAMSKLNRTYRRFRGTEAVQETLTCDGVAIVASVDPSQQRFIEGLLH